MALSSQPGDAAALMPAVYSELRRLAVGYLRHERPGQTLQPTALVHEAYLRLAGAGQPWIDRNHFIGIAARSMRQILVERARARGAQKRWAGLDRVSLITIALGVGIALARLLVEPATTSGFFRGPGQVRPSGLLCRLGGRHQVVFPRLKSQGSRTTLSAATQARPSMPRAEVER